MNKWKEIQKKGFGKNEFAPTKSWDGTVLDSVSLKLIDTQWDMHPVLIDQLVGLRVEANIIKPTSMIISENGGYAMSGHSDTSLHKGLSEQKQILQAECVHELDAKNQNITLGRAADYHYETNGKCWSWLDAVLFTWKHIPRTCGLGFYPYSNTGVIHQDFREGVAGRDPAVWWRDRKGDYKNYVLDDFDRAIKAAIIDTHLNARLMPELKA